MRARRIIEGAAFGPEAIRSAIAAFEAAWSEIADRFDATDHETAREVLANSIISALREDSRDPEVLRGVGLRSMEWAFPSLFALPLPPSDTAESKGN